MENAKKRALTSYEDTNMYGGAHCTNYDTALRAAEEGRDLVVHWRRYDGQRYHNGTYRVTNLRVSGETVIGDVVGETDPEYSRWTATKEVCRFARTGEI